MLGLDLGNLIVHLKGDDLSYQTMLHRTRASLKSLDRQIGTVVKTAAIAGAAISAVSLGAFAKFDDAMTRSTAIMGNMTDEMNKRLRKAAIALSQEGVQSASQLAESYFFLASAGLDAAQSLKALPEVQAFATAGAFDMALATDLITDAQSALGLTVKDSVQNMMNMRRVSDVLVKANTLANATTQQFSEALTSEAGPAMKAYGVALEEGVAVLAAYADQGIKAQHAGSMFSRMLRLMTKGFNDNEAAWDQLNLSIYDTQGNLLPMADIIEQLTEHFKEMSTEQKTAQLEMLGFQARSQQAILPLLGTADAIRRYEEELRVAAGTTQEVADKQLQSFGNQWRIVWNNIKAVGIMLGSILADYLPPVAEFFKSFAQYIQANEQQIRHWVETMGAAFNWLADKAVEMSNFFKEQVSEAEIKRLATQSYITAFRILHGAEAKAFERTVGAGAGFGGYVAETPVDPKLFEQHLSRARRVMMQTRKEWEDAYAEAQPKFPETAEAGAYAVPEIKAPQLPGFPTLEETQNAVDAQQQATLDVGEAYNKLYSEMGKMTESNYKHQMKIINDLADSYRKAGMDRLAIEQWVNEQLRLLNIEYKQSQDSVVAGFEAATLEIEHNMQTWGEKAYEVGIAMKDTFATNIESMMKDFDNFGEHVINILEEIYWSMMRTMVIRPAAESLTTGLMSMWSKPTGNVAPPGMTDITRVSPTGIATAHQGGIASELPRVFMPLPQEFDTAKRYHSGDAEIAAWIKRNEHVLTEEQVNDLTGMAAATPQVTVNITNNTATPIRKREVVQQVSGKEVIVGIILEDINERGPVYKAMKGS